MNNYDPLIFDKREMVIEKLSLLVEHKCVLSADLGKGESLPIIIVAINLESSILILRQARDIPPILNGSTVEQLNKKIVTMPRVEFSTVFCDVQVAFSGVSIKKVTHKGNYAFQMYIPSLLHWHNRRRYDRKKIPIAKSSFCEMVLPIPKSDATDEYKQNYVTAIDKVKNNLTSKNNAINSICLELYDVSLAGCSLLNHDEEFSYFLTPRTTYENSKIIMPDDNEISVSFEIMSKRVIEFDESDDVDVFNELIGIKFLDIKRDVI
ncbi:MAG: flagellar brake protein [Methylococcales bacterium]|nr:flagellar brake protein [Methylococcales bacterium]MDD5754584.1 flagellar brake protein [Methylococcales bacterium]